MAKGGGGGGQINAADLISQQSAANRINQFTPQGTLQFGSVGGQGEFVPGEAGSSAAALTESPFGRRFRQGFEDLATIGQQTAAPRIQNLPLSPIDTSRFPSRRFNLDFSDVDPVPTSGDFSGDADKVSQATFQRGLGLLQPQFDTQNRRLETKLVNQGIPLGSEAFGKDFRDLGQNQGNALSNLALDSVTAGRGEQSRLFSQALASRGAQLGDQIQDINLQNAQRAGAINEQQVLRSGELSELASLLGLQPVQQVGLQSFFAPGNIDVTGPATAQAQQANANANRSASNAASTNQGIATTALALAPLLFSSRYLKKFVAEVNEESVLERLKQLAINFWTYKDDDTEHIGPYAEDFKEAFDLDGDGTTIHLGDAMGILMAAVKALNAKVEAINA